MQFPVTTAEDFRAESVKVCFGVRSPAHPVFNGTSLTITVEDGPVNGAAVVLEDSGWVLPRVQGIRLAAVCVWEAKLIKGDEEVVSLGERFTKGMMGHTRSRSKK